MRIYGPEVRPLRMHPADVRAVVEWWCRECGARVSYRVADFRRAYAYGRCAACVAAEVNAGLRARAVAAAGRG